MTYHLARNGQPAGTCSKEEATARFASGDILPTDLVWAEGMANWLPASQVFASAVPPPTPVLRPPPIASVPVTPPATPTPIAPPAGVKPSNNLVFAILATLFCCIPTGIAAIIFAAQVDSKWNQGDKAGAETAAKNARTWCWVSLGLGILINVIGGIIYAVMISQAVAAGGY